MAIQKKLAEVVATQRGLLPVEKSITPPSPAANLSMPAKLSEDKHQNLHKPNSENLSKEEQSALLKNAGTFFSKPPLTQSQASGKTSAEPTYDLSAAVTPAPIPSKL